MALLPRLLLLALASTLCGRCLISKRRPSATALLEALLASWLAMGLVDSGPDLALEHHRLPVMTPHQKKRILQLVIPLAVLLLLEKISPGLGRGLLAFGTLALVVYCFVNDDKPWARRILNKPKSW